MISTRKLIKMARKWKAASRRRISWPRPVPKKDHFVVYTSEGRRFIIPLTYLKSEILRDLFRMSEEEFGIASSGPITLPCDSIFMEYALSMIGRHMTEEMEKALIISLASSCRQSCLAHEFQEQTSSQLLICSC